MPVETDVTDNQPEKIELHELTLRERTVVQMFRQLDKESQSDIIRFLNAFLAMQ